MNSLWDLSDNISLFNSQGLTLLPYPTLAILGSPSTSAVSQQLQLLLTNDSPVLVSANTLVAGSEYKVITSSSPGIKCNLHVLEGLGCQDIKDTHYKYKKSLLSKFNKQPWGINLVILAQEEDPNTHLGVHFVDEFDPQRRRSMVVRKLDLVQLLDQIKDLHLRLTRLEMVAAYRSLLKHNQNLAEDLADLQEFEEANPVNLLPYIHKQHHLFLSTLHAQFSGTFVRTRRINIKTPLRCLIISRLQHVWEDQYTHIIKAVESIAPKEIQELLLIHNTELMHGFLSGNCFKNIFHSYMVQIEEAIMEALRNLVDITLVTIQHMVHYHLRYLSLKDSYASMITEKINPICQSFLQEMSVFVHSQVQYIYISDERYWRLNNLNTSLYSNATYIEIKYVGIAYIKRLGDSLQEILPKFVGDRFIDRVARVLKVDSLLVLQDLMRTEVVTLVISEEEAYKKGEVRKKHQAVKTVMRFFNRYVDPVSLIPDITEKVNRMMEGMKEVPVVAEEEVEERVGFFQRIRKLFVRSENKRPASQGRKVKAIHEEQDLSSSMRIRETEWLIAINAHKDLQRERIEYSARQGFPPFLRVAIWVHLCKKKLILPPIKQLLTIADPKSQVLKQILKDIRRTSPQELFARDEGAQSIMQDVLLAYSVYDPAVAYVQGMNFIVSMIIRTIINYEEKDHVAILRKHQDNNFLVIKQQTLTILAHLVKNLNWSLFYIDGMPKLFEFCLSLEDRIKRDLPRVWEKMAEESMSTHLVFTEAIMTVLTAKTPLHFSQRIFDCFLVCGERVVEDTMVKLIKINQKEVISASSADEVFNLLREGIYRSVQSLICIDEVLS